MPPVPRSRAATTPGASWLALVAATTFGAGELECVRADIRGDTDIDGAGGAYRLIVQAYTGDGAGRDARPVGAVQRAITAEDLRNGVTVDLVNVRPGSNAPRVLAWIEPGEPILELDGLRAKPAPGGFIGGEACVTRGHASVVLRPRTG